MRTISSALKDVRIDGQRIAYREAGSGPPILFLHGLGGNSKSWEPQFAAFSGSHRVVAWDMPGFGSSESVGKDVGGTRDYSSLAQRFMAALGIEHAIGVATSYGTVILADLAQATPGLIDAMVFACGVTGMGHLDAQERARLRAMRRGETRKSGAAQIRRDAKFDLCGGRHAGQLVARVVDLAGSAQPEGYLQAYGAMTESNIFDSLKDIEVPALVVAGVNDPIARASDCERVARALRNAEYQLHRKLRALRQSGAGGDLQPAGRRVF